MGLDISYLSVNNEVMGRSPNEKNISGDVPIDVFNAFEEFLVQHRNVKRKQLLCAAIDVFMNMPQEIQVPLLFWKKESLQFKDIVSRVALLLPQQSELLDYFMSFSYEERCDILREWKGRYDAAQSRLSAELDKALSKSHKGKSGHKGGAGA